MGKDQLNIAHDRSCADGDDHIEYKRYTIDNGDNDITKLGDDHLRTTQIPGS